MPHRSSFFRRSYYTYVWESSEKARKLTEQEVINTEPTTPVCLQFCVEQKFLESTIDLELLRGDETYADLTVHTLH